MKKWLAVVAVLAGLTLGGSQVSAAEASLTITAADQQFEIAVTDGQGELLNLKPGIKLPEETVALKNETEDTRFEVAMVQVAADDWLVEHLQGTISVGEESFTLAEIMSGAEVHLWPGSQVPVTTHLSLAGGETDSATGKLRGTMKLAFSITKAGKQTAVAAVKAAAENSSSASEKANRNTASEAAGRFPKVGVRMSQFATLGGCFVIVSGVLLLRTKKEDK